MLTKFFQPKSSIGAVLPINHDVTCQTLPPATSQPTSKRTLKSFFRSFLLPSLFFKPLLPPSLFLKLLQLAIRLSRIPQQIGKHCRTTSTHSVYYSC